MVTTTPTIRKARQMCKPASEHERKMQDLMEGTRSVVATTSMRALAEIRFL